MGRYKIKKLGIEMNIEPKRGFVFEWNDKLCYILEVREGIVSCCYEYEYMNDSNTISNLIFFNLYSDGIIKNMKFYWGKIEDTLDDSWGANTIINVKYIL